jgi:hypothetical protein
LIIQGNTAINPTGSGMLILVAGQSMYEIDIENNNFVSSVSSLVGSGVNIECTSTASVALRMFNNNMVTNSSIAPGYLLVTTSAGAFTVQSPNLLLSGVAASNTGTSATIIIGTQQIGAVETLISPPGTISYVQPFQFPPTP